MRATHRIGRRLERVRNSSSSISQAERVRFPPDEASWRYRDRLPIARDHLTPLLVVALAIKLEGGGPFLDRQNCIGCSGRRFQALKFQTTAYDPKLATTAWAQKT